MRENANASDNNTAQIAAGRGPVSGQALSLPFDRASGCTVAGPARTDAPWRSPILLAAGNESIAYGTAANDMSALAQDLLHLAGRSARRVQTKLSLRYASRCRGAAQLIGSVSGAWRRGSRRCNKPSRCWPRVRKTQQRTRALRRQTMDALDLALGVRGLARTLPPEFKTYARRK